MTGRAGVSVRSFVPGDEPAVMDVVEATIEADRLPGIDRHELARAVDRMAGDPGGTAVALEAARIVGFCAPRFDLLFVHPAFRRRGHGRRLVAAGLEIARARGLQTLALFGSTDTAAGSGFIAAMGATYAYSLWRLDLPPDVPVPPATFPSTVAVRPYAHPDDLAAFVELALASFVDHPTPLPFTTEIIGRSHSLPDFDPAAILLASPTGDPATLIAWAKARGYTTDAGEPGGSIDFVGVVPAWRRRGLGRELLHWGIGKLRADGARIVDLSATATNESALELYRSTGFVPAIEWPHFAIQV